MQGPGNKRNYQIHLKSQSGAINVLLVNKDTDTSEPVAVQVPPPKQESSGAEGGNSSITDTTQNQNTDPSQGMPGAVTRGKVGVTYFQ